MRPSAASRRTPATEAADAGSQNRPSSWTTIRCASRISSSLTASISPPDLSRAAIAPSHDAGFPILIAVATVSGDSTGAPRTMGAAPSAWKPSIRGDDVARPSRA